MGRSLLKCIVATGIACVPITAFAQSKITFEQKKSEVTFVEKMLEQVAPRVKRKIDEDTRFEVQRMTIFGFVDPPAEFSTLKRELVYASIFETAARLAFLKEQAELHLRDIQSPSLTLLKAHFGVWKALAAYERQRIEKEAGNAYTASSKRDAGEKLYGRMAYQSWFKEGSFAKLLEPDLKLREALAIFYSQQSWSQCDIKDGRVQTGIEACEKIVQKVDRVVASLPESTAMETLETEVREAIRWLTENVQ